jgi:hypothetical protein
MAGRILDRFRASGAARWWPWAFILAWFFWFAAGGLRAGFTPDDLMNLTIHRMVSPGRLALANLTWWSTVYRPMGGVFYVAMYRLFGLSPLPFRAACFALLVGNVALVYRVCLQLTGSRETALLAALVDSYHAWFVTLYYSTGAIYELLCFGFYLAAFQYYLGVRQAGARLQPRQWVVLAALYIAALDSKELAVTLPLALGCYELIWHPPERGCRGLGRWLGREALGMWLTALVTVPYVIGKLTGPGNLLTNPAYRPEISALRYLRTFRLYLDLVFYQDHFFRNGPAILLLAAMLAPAVWRRSRPMLFAWCFVLFSVLPFIFLPHYSGAFMYLPMFGWALYAASALEMLRYGAGNRIPAPVLFLAVALALGPLHARASKKTLEQFASVQLPIRETIAELHRVEPTAPRGAHLFFVDDPFPARTYWLLFLVQELYDDLTIDVQRAKDGASPTDRRYDAVLRWADGRLVREAPGGEPDAGK